MSNATTQDAINQRRATAYNQNGQGAGRVQQRQRRPAPPSPEPVQLKTRRPTGAVPWPLVVLEGGDFSGKSWHLALLSASDLVGDSYWMDIGDGAADEYGAVPGAKYHVVDHDGTWRDIIGQVEAIHGLARQAHENANKPVCLFIDSMSNVWTMLSEWAEWLARNSFKARRILAQDPYADIQVTMPYWNKARARWRRLMTLLMTFPGICVVTARGKEVAKLGEDGQPIEGKKTYKVEAERNLGFDSTAWVRLSRDDKPKIIGARSVHAGVRPGLDEPVTISGEFTLEWLIFTALKCDPYKAHARDLKPLNPHIGEANEASASGVDDESAPFSESGDAEPDEDSALEVAQFVDELSRTRTKQRINELWDEAKTKKWLDLHSNGATVRELIRRAAERVKALTDGASTARSETAATGETADDTAAQVADAVHRDA